MLLGKAKETLKLIDLPAATPTSADKVITVALDTKPKSRMKKLSAVVPKIIQLDFDMLWQGISVPPKGLCFP